MSRRVFCPVCYQAYRLKLPREIRMAHYFQVTLVGLLLAGALYPLLGFRAWVVFPPLWILFELVFRLWKRLEMVCPHCSFDPVVYKRDPALAKERVQEHMKKAREGSLGQEDQAATADESSAGRTGAADSAEASL